MKRIALVIVALALAGVTPVSARKFVAGDTSAKLKHPGKLVITNDAKGITAFHFDGNIKKALVRLASPRVSGLRYNAFGASLYDSSAPMTPTVPPHLAQYIREAARTHGVDPRLISAVVGRESAFNPSAVSRVGAQGLMQLMPATAKFLGVNDPMNPRENVLGGTRYLKMLMQTFRGDLDLTLAAYNAGPGAVERYKGVPPYRETTAYVAAIRRAYEASLAK